MEYTFNIKDGDQLIIKVHTTLHMEDVYDNLVKTYIYNLIRSTDLPTTVTYSVQDEFLDDLR
jgi:hypothetical protein